MIQPPKQRNPLDVLDTIDHEPEDFILDAVENRIPDFVGWILVGLVILVLITGVAAWFVLAA